MGEVRGGEGGLEGEVTDFATQNLVNSGFAALDSPYERGLPTPPRSSSSVLQAVNRSGDAPAATDETGRRVGVQGHHGSSSQ